MRLQIAVPLISLALTVSSGFGCQSPGTSTPAPTQGSDPAAAAEAAFVGQFSGPRAWEHLEALAAIGTRAAGTPGAEAAREYIRSELAALGLETEQVSSRLRFGSGEEPRSIEVVSLSAEIPARSSDLVLLIAPYDSAYQESFRFAGVNDGASGTAVLLEVARLLVEKPLPYTTRFYFLDGEAPLGRDRGGVPESIHLGSRAVARSLERAGAFSRVRLLLYLNRVSDSDLRIARDRFSHRIYRDAFWKAAARLGHRDVFPADSHFEAPDSGHRTFFDLGMRRVVTIEDTGFGDGDTQLARYTEDDDLDRSSQASLATVGQVVVSGLRDITASLEQIDRFSEAPTIPVQDLPAVERREDVKETGPEVVPTEPPPATPEVAEPPAEDPPT